jgi:signal transduction histidine kinase
VLNSVNVSANLLRDGLAVDPTVALLGQATELLRHHEHDLTAFLRDDPKGRMLVPFLRELAADMTAGRRKLAQEVDSLSQNIEHIKQIVAAQQTHAKSVGVIQEIDPDELRQDALRIAQASVSRHGVDLLQDQPGRLPRITTDRHQILQILVNLITNAIQAVKPRPPGQRRIWLRIDAAPDSLTYTVKDNGVGIPPENMRHIFQHGFSTRRDGHGFGLHSGALLARKLGGELTSASDGADQGATFILRLPLQSPDSYNAPS